jgi:MFS superfamily sulfate permease-like transporter
VLFFSHLLAALPQPVLAAIVLVAVAGLISVSALKHLWRSDRREFAIAMIAMIGVLTQGLLRGVMIAAIISLILLIRQAAMPPVAVLGRIPGTDRFSDCERHQKNETVPGVLILRPGASLIYFNMEHVRDRIMERVWAEKGLELLVLDLSEVPFMDVHAAEMLAGLTKKLKTKGIVVDAVEAHSEVRERLRGEGLDERLGGIDRFQTVAGAVEGFLKRHPAESR